MIKIANAPCSWGVLEFDLAGQAAGYAQVLDEMQLAGYAGTELGDWGFMPSDPHILKDALQERDLELLAAFIPVAFSDPEAHIQGEKTAARTARLLKEVGKAPFIVLSDDNGADLVRTHNAGRIQPKHGLSAEGWSVFITGVERVARRVRSETGLRCVFHPHCAGFVETPAEIEMLLSRTDPDLVGLCFDTGHYTYGGGDALEGVRKFAGRIWHFHIKDFDPSVGSQAQAHGWDYFEAVRRGIFCELGKGCVAFPSVLQELDRTGYEGWGVVEQDVLPEMGTPFESALRNRAYLRKLGL